MGLSVIMTVCLFAADGSTSCSIGGNSQYSSYKSESDCSQYADSSINDALLESGQNGWASGICVDRKDYVSAVKKSVSYLQSKGHKVTFKAFKDSK